MIITIDGPVASGKSTVSRMVAHRLGYYYICSGLLYRSLAYLLVNKYGYTHETIAHATQADVVSCFDPIRFSYCYDENIQEHVFFDNEDITSFLKERYIDTVSSLVSVNTFARQAIMHMQRAIAMKKNVVIDGRDVGSVVFPDADIKFFMTASIEVRAERWRKDQEKYGNYFSLDQAIASIAERDSRDENRSIAPLIVPQDAVVIDTSSLTIQQTVDVMITVVG